MPGRPLGKVLEFMQLLWAVDHNLQSTSKRMGARLGITGPQRLVIRIVGRFPGIGAGALAGILRVHPSTLTGVLQRLERRKILERRPDPADGRRAVFTLTGKGRTLDAARSGTVEAAVTRALASVSDRELESARKVLGALEAELREDSQS